MQILPLTLDQMLAANLIRHGEKLHDEHGNAKGYLVVKFGNAGRADFWTGDCWWSYREFNPNRHRDAIFSTVADAEHFVKRKALLAAPKYSP